MSIVPRNAPGSPPYPWNGTPARTRGKHIIYAPTPEDIPHCCSLPPGFPGDQNAANGPGDPGTDPVTFHPRGPDMRSSPKNSTKTFP
jgi:hypothetical protein